MHRLLGLLLICLFTISLVACDDSDDGGITGTGITGSVMKGPFLQGTTVEVIKLKQDGSPTDTIYQTETSDNLGSFYVDVDSHGAYKIEANGYHYNELTGGRSTGELTLRAVIDVTDDSYQSAYVNVLTHTIYRRVLTLMSQGKSAAEAIDVAQQEILFALSDLMGDVDIQDFSQLNLYNSENANNEEGNAYLLTLSASIYQYATNLAAINDGSSVDAELAYVLGLIANDFADDGTIDDSILIDNLALSQSQIDPEVIEENLNKIREDNGAEPLPVPNITSYLDHIYISTPAENSVLNEPAEVTVAVPSILQGEVLLELEVAGEVIAEDSTYPYTLSWNPYFWSSSEDVPQRLIVKASIGEHFIYTHPVDVMVSASAMNQLIVISPTDRAIIRDQNGVQFSWNKIVEATSYTVEVYDANGKTAEEVTSENTLLLNGLTQGDYQWRFKGNNDVLGKSGTWSHWNHFSIDGPLAPTEVTYIAEKRNGSYSVNFGWNEAEFSNEYIVQLSQKMDFSTLHSEDRVTSPVFNGNLSTGIYYCRVKAINSDLIGGSWSEVVTVELGEFIRDFKSDEGDLSSKQMIPSIDGGYIVLGQTDYSGSADADYTNVDDWIAKLDSEGHQQWVFTIEDGDWNTTYDLTQLTDGSIVVVGDALEGVMEYRIAAALMLDNEGNEVWNVRYQEQQDGSVKYRYRNVVEFNGEIHFIREQWGPCCENSPTNLGPGGSCCEYISAYLVTIQRDSGSSINDYPLILSTDFYSTTVGDLLVTTSGELLLAGSAMPRQINSQSNQQQLSVSYLRRLDATLNETMLWLSSEYHLHEGSERVIELSNGHYILSEDIATNAVLSLYDINQDGIEITFDDDQNFQGGPVAAGDNGQFHGFFNNAIAVVTDSLSFITYGELVSIQNIVDLTDKNLERDAIDFVRNSDGTFTFLTNGSEGGISFVYLHKMSMEAR